MLKSFDGDKTKLGNAEKFYLMLLDLSSYKLRIEGMLLKDEFSDAKESLESNINTMTAAIKALMENQSLTTFLRLVLETGNFMNTVSNCSLSVTLGGFIAV